MHPSSIHPYIHPPIQPFFHLQVCKFLPAYLHASNSTERVFSSS
jgi:hypothetical protein